MFRVSSINKSILLIYTKRMDWAKYYQDQINKSNNNRLNKLEDFTGNYIGKGKEGGFFNPFWEAFSISQQFNS